ncbi:MAG: methanogenesis marker 12 protein [Methanoculleaceae archaeon]
MYIGIDHGTTAMRFSNGREGFKIPRREARNFRIEDLTRLCPLDEIEGIAVSYSMGDGISAITDIRHVRNRGVVSREGAGEHTGGGTRVYDAVKESGLPAIVVPGIHRGSPTDPRFKVYSHQASPEKVGIALRVCEDLGPDVVVTDCSSNTVTMLVSGGRIAGAIDACIFAPGTAHGALDVDAIRAVDQGTVTANEAFMRAGVEHALPEEERIPALALFAAMESAGLLLLNPDAAVAVAGSMGSAIHREMVAYLRRPVALYDEWCASEGLAMLARRVFNGASEILGLPVDL